MNMDMDRKPLPPPPAVASALPLQHLSFDHPSFDHSSFDLFDHRIVGSQSLETLNVQKHDHEVDWDGPNDPANPKNWKSSSRMLQVLPIAFFALNMNLAATMFAPGVDELVAEFGITDSTIATMTLSIYVLGFAMGVVIAPLSELYGRLWLYHASNAVWLAFTLGCAFATNTASFMVFRFLAGCAGSVPMTTGAGTVADIVPPKDRGKFMAIWGLGPLIGPVVGPIVGGFMSQAVGWRWTFRLLAILGGISRRRSRRPPRDPRGHSAQTEDRTAPPPNRQPGVYRGLTNRQNPQPFSRQVDRPRTNPAHEDPPPLTDRAVRLALQRSRLRPHVPAL